MYVTHDPYSTLGLTEHTVIHVVNELWTVNYVVEINGSDSKELYQECDGVTSILIMLPPRKTKLKQLYP